MRQYEHTKANWISVRVAGLSKVVRIDFEEVLVRAEDQYHIIQSPYREEMRLALTGSMVRDLMSHTISL